MPSVTNSHEALQPVKFDANGNARIDFRGGSNMVVHQVSVRTDSRKQTFCTITKGGAEPPGSNLQPPGSAVVCSTRAGNQATSSGAPAVALGPSELFSICWNGGNQNDTAYADIHFQILEG